MLYYQFLKEWHRKQHCKVCCLGVDWDLEVIPLPDGWWRHPKCEVTDGPNK